MNFLDIPTLMRLADMLTPHYTVVYVRPGWMHQIAARGYAADGSEASPDLTSGLQALLLTGADLITLGDATNSWEEACWQRRYWCKGVMRMEMAFLGYSQPLHLQGEDMPDLGEYALLKQSHPDLVLFQDLVAEAWRDME